MPHILQNKNLEVHIDLPLESYNFSRFDWTGKIVKVKYQDIQLSSVERADGGNQYLFGKGFYNEFGIDTALGFEETQLGGWFHKIGVGLLKKEDDNYFFSKKYEIDPADFEVDCAPNRVLIICKSKEVNGYSYLLRKEIELQDSGFVIKYSLQNTGVKDIVTNEYVHNFTAINKDLMGRDYVLKFPFELKSHLFVETVNPEQKVDIEQNGIKFSGSPKQQFFFSNLSGNEEVDAGWELINLRTGIGISETGDFKTNQVNLWGWSHVVCPELFFKVFAEPGQTIQWSRTYQVYETA
jgi:hypothetical protein